MHKFKELKVWQKAMELVKETYIITYQLPKSEQFGLISQINRCAVSIPSNIAEGAGRNSPKEFLHFLSISNGSAYELETQLLLTVELGFTKLENIQKHFELLNEVCSMNYALQNHLKQK